MLAIKIHKSPCEADKLNVGFSRCTYIDGLMGEYDIYYDGIIRLICVEHAALLIRIAKNLFDCKVDYSPNILER